MGDRLQAEAILLLPVSAMVAIIAAYFAVFIPYVFPLSTLNAFNVSHEVFVDLGYQLNRGQRVVVSCFCSEIRFQVTADPNKLLKDT